MENENYERLEGAEYTQIRKKVLSRDGHQCINCDSTENLEVHHIVPLSKSGTNEISNLVSVCPDCHYKIHGKTPTEKAETQETVEREVRWTPSRQDITTFINNITHPAEKAIAMTIIKTGIGVGELCNLSDTDVYLANEGISDVLHSSQPTWINSEIPALRVQDSCDDQRYNPRRDRKHSSIIPVDKELQRLLTRWIAIRPDQYDKSRPFFMSTSTWGSHLTRDAVHHLVESNAKPLGMYKKDQELKNLTPYTLRHFFIERFKGDSAVREYILGRLPELPYEIEELATHYLENVPTFLNRRM